MPFSEDLLNTLTLKQTSDLDYILIPTSEKIQNRTTSSFNHQAKGVSFIIIDRHDELFMVEQELVRRGQRASK